MEPAGENGSLTAASNGTVAPDIRSNTLAVGGGPRTDIAGFGDIESDQRGDVVRIPVYGVPAGGYVTVTLGEQSKGYVSNVTVRDDDGDGDVTLRWNSYLADGDQNLGDDSPWSATGSDTVVNQNVQSPIADGPSHIISAGTYPLEAREGRIQDGATDQLAGALSTVTLSERETNDINTWRAPKSYSGELTTLSDLQSAAGQQVTETDSVAKGDLLITEIQASGLEGALRAQDGDTAKAKFYDAVVNGLVGLNHTSAPDSDTNTRRDTITVNQLQTGDYTTFIPAYNDDAYYIIHRTGAEERFLTRQTFTTQFSIKPFAESEINFGLVAPTSNGEFSEELLTEEFTIAPGRIEVSRPPGGTVELRAQPNQLLSGTSTYAPGTTFQVRLQTKTGASSQFVIGPREVTVQPDGSWALPVDFSSYDVGTGFDIEVSKDGETVVTADGSIIAEPEVRALSFPDQEIRSQVVTIDEVELNAGGFVVLREDSPSGPVIGHSSYIEANERATNLRVVLDRPLESGMTMYATPYVDSDNNQQFDDTSDTPYTMNGDTITDAAAVTLEGGSAEFEVSQLTPVDVTANNDDTLDVSAEVTNTGSADGTQTVSYRISGSTIRTQEVSLASGEAVTVQFTDVELTGLEGSFSHGITTDDDSQLGSLTVEPERSASIGVLEIAPGNVTVSSNEQVAISVTLGNDGQAPASRTVDLLLDGSLFDRESVTVEPGSTRTVEFDTVQTEGLQPGTHQYTITTENVQQTRTFIINATQSGRVDTLSFGSDGPGTEKAVLESVSLSAGGFVAIHEGSASGPVVGVSEYLEGGQEHENVTVSYDESVSEGSNLVAVGHYDTNENRAFDYSSSDSSVDGPYATSADQIAEQEVASGSSGSSDASDSSESGIQSSHSIVDRIGLLPLIGAGILGLGIVGFGWRRFRGSDKPEPRTKPDSQQRDTSAQQNRSEPTQTERTETERSPRTEASGTESPAQDAAGAAADSAAESTPEQDEDVGVEDSTPTLEREVRQLSDMVLRESGPAIATYDATVGTHDGEMPAKVLTVAPAVDVDEELEQQFERAAGQWFNASTHPNVRTVHDRGTEPRPWIAVEKLPDAGTLRTHQGELSVEETVDVLGDVVEAVRNVGLYNGTHYNLSPDCVTLATDADGYTAIVDDWGVERAIREHTDGTYVTPYTAPEQLSGGAVGDQTDVYGLGALTYYSLAGEPPCPADETAIQNGNIRDVSELAAVPPELNTAVMTALATTSTERHRSPYDFGQALSSSIR